MECVKIGKMPADFRVALEQERHVPAEARLERKVGVDVDRQQAVAGGLDGRPHRVGQVVAERAAGAGVEGENPDHPAQSPEIFSGT